MTASGIEPATYLPQPTAPQRKIYCEQGNEPSGWTKKERYFFS